MSSRSAAKPLRSPRERGSKTASASLVVERASLPDCLEVSAWTQNADGSHDEIMGLRHRALAIEGVQFHPESILTQHGHALLRNFLARELPRAA